MSAAEPLDEADGRPAPRTINISRLSRRRRLLILQNPATHPRPRTRAECVDGPRPCPYVGCKHHLFLEVNQDNGSIRFNFPELEPDEIPQTCALDVADRGEHSLDEVAELLNMSRQRVNQVEIAARSASSRDRILRQMHEEENEGIT